jgi:chromosomal replication initiation ATPase DnaA
MNIQPNPTQSDAFIIMMKSRPERDFNPYEILMNYLDIYVKEDKTKFTLIRDLRIEYIKRTVCNYYSLSFDEVNNNCREKDVMEIKQFIQYFCRKKARATYKRIGKIFTYKTKYKGKSNTGIDHTTVMSNERKVQDLIDTDKVIAAKYKDITAIIENDINNGIIRF